MSYSTRNPIAKRNTVQKSDFGLLQGIWPKTTDVDCIRIYVIG